MVCLTNFWEHIGKQPTPPREKGVEKPTSEAKQNKCKKNDEAVVE